MTLLTLRGAHLAYGQEPLLDDAQLALAPGERIGLIGRNGAGKSTLLKVIARRVALDTGALELRDGLRVVLVEQEVALARASTPFLILTSSWASSWSKRRFAAASASDCASRSSS